MVIYTLKKVWKLKGSIKVKSDGFVFLFLFSCEEDKNKILQSDPIIMSNKLFIIKSLDPNIGNFCCSISPELVWVKFYSIPIFSWSPIGVN